MTRHRTWIMKIKNYSDFCAALLDCGFTMGGGNSEGIFSLISWDWKQEPPYDTPVSWHTGDPETDPWEWRMRVLEERRDIAYGKVFFNKSGYITKDWIPYFLAARRGAVSLEEAYESGTISSTAKRIYHIITEYGKIPMHEIKRAGGFTKEDHSRFDKAVTELQMKMVITMCGRERKMNKNGEGYGWSSTCFCTVEDFWKDRGVDIPVVDRDEAVNKITRQVLKLNPDANERKLKRFING